MKSILNRSPTVGQIGLLHNMGGGPRPINHTGVSYGTRVGFRLSEGVASRGPLDLLRLLGEDVANVTGERAETILKDILCTRGTQLTYPPAAPVAAQADPGDTWIDDPLAVMTVLAKSSNHVYLRDKEPILDRITPERRVILIFPPNWRSY